MWIFYTPDNHPAFITDVLQLFFVKQQYKPFQKPSYHLHQQQQSPKRSPLVGKREHIFSRRRHLCFVTRRMLNPLRLIVWPGIPTPIQVCPFIQDHRLPTMGERGGAKDPLSINPFAKRSKWGSSSLICGWWLLAVFHRCQGFGIKGSMLGI